jgi:hypothetical protein
MIEPVARLRITLQDIEPAIWRRVDMPVSATLFTLHTVIQAVMRWQDAHLFEFVVGDRVYGEPHPDDGMYERKVYRAKGIRLKQLLDRGVDRFLYVYDFGDDWRHDVVIEGVRDGDADTDYPAFVDGARRGPPEDVGGPTGFEEFLAAVTKPRHRERNRMLTWYGGPYDPDDIDERAIRIDLAMIAEFRRRGLLGHRARAKGATS